MQTDMTTGKPVKLLLLFMLPCMVGNILQQLYGIADTVMVGRFLGMNALAAVGASGGVIALTIGTIQGLATGFSAITSQRFGAGDMAGVKKSFAMSILITGILGLIGTVFFVRCAKPLLHLLNVPAEVFEDAYRYVFWILVSCVAACLYNLLGSMIRALGDSKSPLVFLVVSGICNVCLNYLFICVWKVGIAGAGIATMLAQLLSGILCVFYIAKKVPLLHLSLSDFRPDVPMLRNLLKIGLPMAFLSLVLYSGAVTIQYANNTLGTVYVATLTAASKIEGFVTVPIISFSSAVTVFAAQNYGAGRFDRIRTGGVQGIGVVLIWSVISFLVFLVFGRIAMEMLAGNESEAVIQNGYRYLLIQAAGSVILGPVIVWKFTLQAVGRTTVPVLSGFVESFCRAFVSVWLSKKFGFLGVSLAMPVGWFGVAIPIVIDYIFLMRKFRKQEQKKMYHSE